MKPGVRYFMKDRFPSPSSFDHYAQAARFPRLRRALGLCPHVWDIRQVTPGLAALGARGELWSCRKCPAQRAK